MKLRRILFSALLCAGCLAASAQDTATREVFNPHWYVQGQFGGQYTLGELKCGKLLSPNAQIGAGYRFTSVWGLRLSLDGWQSKDGSKLNTGKYDWKYSYLAPQLDATCDLTNWIGGYNPKRLCSAGLLAGVGLNIAWDNDEAAAANAAILADHGVPAGNDVAFLRNLWDGTKCRAVGRFGAYVDFNVSRRVALGLEVSANMLSDKYNSKKAGNLDWYMNGLVGVKVALGKTSKTVEAERPCCHKVVEKIVYRDREVEKAEALRRDIFFNIRGSVVSKTEMPKVEDIVTYLNKYPQAKVSITGYADKGTGNPRINAGYAQKRAQMVADLLTRKYGIAADRISVSSKGDSEQPYQENELNRVSICVAK